MFQPIPLVIVSKKRLYQRLPPPKSTENYERDLTKLLKFKILEY